MARNTSITKKPYHTNSSRSCTRQNRQNVSHEGHECMIYWLIFDNWQGHIYPSLFTDSLTDDEQSLFHPLCPGTHLNASVLSKFMFR